MNSITDILVSLIIIVAIGAVIVAVRRRRTRRPAGTSTCRPLARATAGARTPSGRTPANTRNTTPSQRGSSLVSANETEVMDYFANTRHGQKDNWFQFKYKKVGSEWRAYIIRMPPLNGRSASAHSTHRYSDPQGNFWVCRNPQPTNLKDCQAISKVWADRYLEYVATGVEANAQLWP